MSRRLLNAPHPLLNRETNFGRNPFNGREKEREREGIFKLQRKLKTFDHGDGVTRSLRYKRQAIRDKI